MIEGLHVHQYVLDSRYSRPNCGFDLAAHHMRVAQRELGISLNVNGHAVSHSGFPNGELLRCETTFDALIEKLPVKIALALLS